MKLAQQITGTIMPIKKAEPRVKAQKIAEDVQKFAVYKHLRYVRGVQRTKGKREKAAKAAQEEGLGAARR